MFLALAKEVPNPNDGKTLVANPYKTWNDINPALPDQDRSPRSPPTSGTRDAFVELAMEGGCKNFDWIKALKKTDKNHYKAICHTVREDGAYVEAGENDNLIVQKLEAIRRPGHLRLQLPGPEPRQDPRLHHRRRSTGIREHRRRQLSVSRPLFFYVKAAHVDVIPGIKEYVAEFTSDNAWGDEGYLRPGLIPLPAENANRFPTATTGCHVDVLALSTDRGARFQRYPIAISFFSLRYPSPCCLFLT